MKMTDDDDNLRFGDVKGTQHNSRSSDNRSDRSGLLDTFVQLFTGMVMIYVLLKTVEILTDISIPLI